MGEAVTEMVERVARAICCADRNQPDGSCELAWVGFVDDARAAIAAMREPNDEMMEAGEHVLLERSDRAPAPVWEVMIDAALK